MRTLRTFAVLLPLAITSCHGPAKTKSDPKLEAEAREFVARTDSELRRIIVAESQAQWANATDITDEHEAAAGAASAETMSFLTRSMLESRKFDPILDNLDPDTRRQIKLLRVA